MVPRGWPPALKLRNLPAPRWFRMHPPMIDRAKSPMQRKEHVEGCIAAHELHGRPFPCLAGQHRVAMALITDPQSSGLPWQKSFTRKRQALAGSGKVYRVDDRASLSREVMRRARDGVAMWKESVVLWQF